MDAQTAIGKRSRSQIVAALWNAVFCWYCGPAVAGVVALPVVVVVAGDGDFFSHD